MNDIAKETHWPLFDRIRLYADSKEDIRAARVPHFQGRSAGETPVYSITPDTFNVDALRHALAVLPESGGEVLLPPGRLELSEPLHLRSGVRLVGVPGATELVFRDTDFGIALIGAARAPLKQIQLENLRIRHEGTHKFCAAILITQSEDIRLTNVEVLTPRAVGFLLADNVRRAHLIRCSVSHAGLGGFMLVRDVTDTVLQSCTAEYCQQSGIFLTDLKLPPATDPLDFDKQIHYTLEVVKNFAPFSPEDPVPFRNTLKDCVFRRNRKMGVTTDGVGYLRVVNCVIAENDCEGITIDNGSWGCQVQNCHIYQNGWRGLQHQLELNVDFVDDSGLLADGASKAKLPGVSLDNAAYTRIENNIIEGNWGDGVKFVRAGYACTVRNNIIADNNKGRNDRFHFFGVLVGSAERQHADQSDFASTRNYIEHNDILGAHYAGVHLLADCVGNVVRHNRIVGASCMAVEDHAAHGNIVENNMDL